MSDYSEDELEETSADIEDEMADYGIDPDWTDGCPFDVCIESGWCHHRYKRDPREKS
jgi:hypothetical protein